MTFILHAPQIIYLILVGIGFIVSLFLSNQKIEQKTSLGNTLITTMIASVLGLLILYWGKAFTTIGVPQVLILITYILGFFDILHYVTNPTELKYPRFFMAISHMVASFGLVYWAGFFAGN